MIPFAIPNFSEEDLEQISTKVKEVLKSGWLTSGPLGKEFEDKFAELVGTNYAVALNSCTAALHASLISLGIKEGDEVIVPSNTFIATANAVLYVGAKPVFADVDPKTFNISPIDIEEKLSSKTKAIIVVHLAGNPCDMNKILQIAKTHNLFLIEDSAHAHGALYKGHGCGSFGESGCFSFYPTKVLTCAEGGMVVTNKKDVADKIRIIRNHGRAGYGPNANTEIGFNYRLSDVHAAIGLSQLDRAKEFVDERNRIAKRYSQELSGISWIRPQFIESGNLCSFYAYVLMLENDAPLTRNEVMEYLKNKGVGSSILYNPVHLQPIYKRLFGYQRGMLPVTEEIGDQSLAIPLFSGMDDEQVSCVIKTLKELEK